jgi:hypothetical protein
MGPSFYHAKDFNMANENDKNKLGQTKVEHAKPPEPALTSSPPARTSMDVYLETSKAYLESKGWVMVGYDRRGVPMWTDSSLEGKQEELKPGPLMQDKEGHEYRVMQMHVPPLNRPRDTDNAMFVQRAKDKDAADQLKKVPA